MVAAGIAVPSNGVPTDWKPAIESLVRSLDEARHFRGSLFTVYGPPGVGRIRLIETALTEANVSSRRIRRTFLEPEDAENPYKAVLSIVRWAANLEEVAPALDSGSLVLAPFVRAIAFEPGGSGAGRPTKAEQGAESTTGLEYQRLLADLEFYKRGVEAWGERSRFLHEVSWVILDAAARRHVVWVVESAQFLDSHSLAVIRYLSGCLEENPLVVWLSVDTAGDGQLPKPIAALLEGPRGRGLEVPRLNRRGVLEVLRSKFPTEVFPDTVVDSILSESGGLLVTAEQLASDLRRLRSPGPLLQGTGSDALSGLLGRLEGLPPSSRDLLDRLAVVGVEISLKLAVRLSGTGKDEADVRSDLASLVAAGFLLEQEEGRYCFRVTGLAGEIEARLSPERSRALHQEAALALEALTPGYPERVFDLARHWRKAEVWDAAARASLRAARFSLDSFAPEGGLVYAERAIEASRRTAGSPSSLEAEALVEQGRALYDLGRLHESLLALRGALKSIGTGPEVWPLRARALFYLARTLSSLARPQEAIEVMQEASNALARVEDARARLMLYQVIGVAFMMSNQNREAVDPFRSMLSIAQSLGDGREISYAQKNLSAVLLALNPHDDEGWRLVNSALEYHTRTNNFAGLAAGYLNRSFTELDLGDAQGALQDLARARRAAEFAHTPLLLTSAVLQETAVLLDRADAGRAEALLKELAPWMPAMEEPWALVSFTLLMARVAEAQQRQDDAARLYEEATLTAEPGGESPTLWECRLRRAALARRMGAMRLFEQLREVLPPLDDLRKTAPALAVLREQLEAPAA